MSQTKHIFFPMKSSIFHEFYFLRRYSSPRQKWKSRNQRRVTGERYTDFIETEARKSGDFIITTDNSLRQHHSARPQSPSRQGVSRFQPAWCQAACSAEISQAVQFANHEILHVKQDRFLKEIHRTLSHSLLRWLRFTKDFSIISSESCFFTCSLNLVTFCFV